MGASESNYPDKHTQNQDSPYLHFAAQRRKEIVRAYEAHGDLYYLEGFL
jgi:hypothetical protein